MKDKDLMQFNEPELFPHQPKAAGHDSAPTGRGVFLPLWLAVLLLALVAASLLFTTLYFVRSYGYASKLETVLQENEMLRKKVEYYGAAIDSISAGLDSLSIKLGSEPGLNYPYFSGGAPRDEAKKIDPTLAARIRDLDSRLLDVLGALNLSYPDPDYALGQNNPLIPHGDGIPSIYPTFGRLSDGWGTRIHPITMELEFHTGLDISNKIGTPIYATADGVVRFAGYENGYGKYVIITHDEGFESHYGHLYGFQVRVGDKVGKGQIIALMGSSGLSTGPHLHYAVTQNGEALNPALFLNRIDTDQFAGR